jgi:hypothetical protein
MSKSNVIAIPNAKPDVFQESFPLSSQTYFISFPNLRKTPMIGQVEQICLFCFPRNATMRLYSLL